MNDDARAPTLSVDTRVTPDVHQTTAAAAALAFPEPARFGRHPAGSSAVAVAARGAAVACAVRRLVVAMGDSPRSAAQCAPSFELEGNAAIAARIRL
jgi:hypothetical protein